MLQTKSIPISTAAVHRRFAFILFSCSACLGLLAGAAGTHAKPVPENLGNGLDRLVESHLAIKAAAKTGRSIASFTASNGQSYTTEESAALASLAIGDGQGRVLVRVNPNGSLGINSLIESLQKKLASFTVTSIDPTYREVGVMNAYVALDDVPALGNAAGVRSVILELKPRHNKAAVAPAGRLDAQPSITPGQTITQLGTYTDQGVFQHRVDQINRFYNPAAAFDFEGLNLSIACLSNSFAANTAHPASLDVTNNDLPGNPSNPVNTTPVFVLNDDLSSTSSDDEGRGMCQIVYKMAPKAKIGFATADTGEVGFANAIRGLAGINSSDFPNASTQGFAADVICDDVGYFDEPFFQDGIIGAGVNDVAAAGVAYFSSAANDIGVNGYESATRWVANGAGLTAGAGNTALAGTNINLTGVPANLYAGGFHNFNPNPGQLDVAQTVNIASNANEPPTILQWNDPYDQNTVPNYTATLFTTTDTYTTADKTYAVTGTITQGTLYEVRELATAGSTFDGIITVYKSDGATVISGPQDTGTDETVRFYAPANDTGFVVKVGHFSTTTGQFTLTVKSASGFAKPIAANLSLLVFNLSTGAFISSSSLTTDTTATNQPIQLGYTLRPTGATQVQYVIARSTVPADPAFPTRVRYLIPGNGLAGIGPAEYFTYNTVTTSGHAMAQGCNGTAAYSPFRPNIPEAFTSPGPVLIYFSANGSPINPPEVRLQPRIAALDGGNISANEGLAGLGSDSTSDYDTAANFSGTSAAAPHAAACALLVLEAHGGRGSVTPAQMTTLLQTTTFLHDLDPNSSTAVARATNGGKITMAFNSDLSTNNGTGLNDANSLAVAYVGPSYISTLVFNSPGDAAHAGNPNGGNNGLDTTQAYFSNSFPGLVFASASKAFTTGSLSNLTTTAGDVTAAFSNLAPAPSSTQNWTMSLAFPNNNFTGGKSLRFTVGRAIQHSSVVPSGTTSNNASADLFGDAVLIPEGTVSTGAGMAFNGTLGDGSTFSGRLTNRIGRGYSKLDGYGFINVEAAAQAPLP